MDEVQVLYNKTGVVTAAALTKSGNVRVKVSASVGTMSLNFGDRVVGVLANLSFWFLVGKEHYEYFKTEAEKEASEKTTVRIPDGTKIRAQKFKSKIDGVEKRVWWLDV